jgi:hypothetical protein
LLIKFKKKSVDIFLNLFNKKPINPLRKIESVHSKIELPHPGTSYNPDFDDHQQLLLKAYEIELKKLKREEKELKKLKNNVQKMTWQQIEVRLCPRKIISQYWFKPFYCNEFLKQRIYGWKRWAWIKYLSRNKAKI